MRATRPMGAARWRAYVPAILCAVAGVIHLAVAPEHFAEAFPEGAFMLSAGIIQLVFAALLWRTPSRPVTAAATAETAILLLTYLLSRTVGLPFGPAPWRPEAVGMTDVICKLSEVGLLLALAAGWHRRPQSMVGMARGLDRSRGKATSP